MRIASTTFTSNRQDIIGDALRSVVDWCDLCIVIDLGITDSTLAIAHEICGDKLHIERGKWDDDTAKWRNLMLFEAFRFGADWSVTLDTDERLQANGTDF